MIRIKKIKRAVALGLSLTLMASMAACSSKSKEMVLVQDSEDKAPIEVEHVDDVIEKNTSAKFGPGDMIIDSIKYKASEDEVKAAFGDPDAIDEKEGAKTYFYTDLTFFFENIDGKSVLTALTSSSEDHTFARGIKIGDSFDKVLETFYHDDDPYNKNYLSEDNTELLGKFLYGDYTLAELEKIKPAGKVEYGLLNVNGDNLIEYTNNYVFEYTYMDVPYKKGYATDEDDFCQLYIEVDGGTVKYISWDYFKEIND